MKKLKIGGSIMRGLAVGLAVFGCVSAAKAIPFASGITNIGGGTGPNGRIQFIMNEAGANVTVVYEDGTTNVNFDGITTGLNIPAGRTNFDLGSHTSYQIFAFKGGTGTPVQITTDTNPNGFNIWNSPRGIDTIKNPKKGAQFGRMFIGSSAGGVNGLGAFTTKGVGLYAISADCSDSYLGKGTNATYTAFFNGGTGSSQSSPKNLSVNDFDNTVDVVDNSATIASIYKVDADFQNTPITILSPVGDAAGRTALQHSRPWSALTTGSIATGDLKLYTADPDLPCPASATILGIGGNGQTLHGQFNNIMRYDIGAGPLPFTGGPVFAVNYDLPTFQIDSPGSVALNNADSSKLYGNAFRANYSDGTVQVYDRTTGNLIYTSLTAGGTDVFNPNGVEAPYTQLRVSPDGKYLGAQSVDNFIYVVNLVGGIPDESSLVTIANTPNGSNFGNSRGFAFDAADNVYSVSSGQGLMRGYSLGISATTISSNDMSGNNGSFQVIFPPASASITATTPLASQNYINNTINPGAPTPGVFTITLNTNNLSSGVAVKIALTGTAVFGTNYTINSTDANGVTYASNLVTFPVGAFPGGGNWTAQLKIIPTATPVSGPTLTVNAKISGGLNYATTPPVTANVSIANTGPQVLVLSSIAKGATMNRGIPGDYAEYVVTRLGDTNGPGNNSLSITPHSYTVTNFTLSGTAAVFPTDYTAPSQRIDPANNGLAASPTNGAYGGIVIYPGNVAVTAVVGNPVRHTNLALTPTNVTIIVSLTNNTAPFTNLVSAEGLNYSVNTNNTVTLTEFDNTVGPEVTYYANPLTNSADSSWTLVYANTNLASNPVLPVVIPNYVNGQTEIAFGGANDFEVTLGNPVASDTVPPSPVMAANGWTTALKMTVNKDSSGSASAVNLYPQGQNFLGNVALRFSMYLSLVDAARGSTAQGSNGREFALFGIDHFGTNANWRPSLTVLPGQGAGPTNWDGIWFGVDADSGSLTPADYDAFSSPALPNNNGTPDSDLVSNTTAAENGVFKNPPFIADELATGGNPANQWVEVDIEKMQTNNVFNAAAFNVFNISSFIDRSSILSSFLTTNSSSQANYTNGTFMLGYSDPLADVSDSTAFVYYSNVRVVELCPYVTTPPRSIIVLSGANVSLTNTATYAAIAGLTNTWSAGITTPVTTLQTDTNNLTTITSVYTTNGITKGTNYIAIAKDAAGSFTNINVVEVISGPGNISANPNAKAIFTVVPSGQSAPTSFQWSTNGVNLVNGTKYTNVTAAALGVSNAAPADTLVTYVCTVVNAAGTVQTPAATLTLNTPPSGAVVAPASLSTNWGATVTFSVTASGTAPFTYQWKKNTVNIAAATKSSLSLTNITTADAANYTAGVTNGAGGTLSSAGVLTVAVPPPTISSVAANGTSVTLAFSTPNTTDRTNGFILQSSPVVTGPYTNTAGTFTGSAGGPFQVVAPQTTNANMFYRLLHSN